MTLLQQAQQLGTARLIVRQIEADSNALREITTSLTAKGHNIVVLLAAVNEGKIAITAGVSKELSKTVKAGELVNFVATQVGGKGGGRPDLAQAGGQDVDQLATALSSVANWLKAKAV